MSRLPAIKPIELVRVLRKVGFEEHHQKGSHLYMWNPTMKRMTTVPMHARDLHRGLVHAIIKQAELTEKEFRELL